LVLALLVLSINKKNNFTLAILLAVSFVTYVKRGEFHLPVELDRFETLLQALRGLSQARNFSS
jgi:hypothetical protein